MTRSQEAATLTRSWRLTSTHSEKGFQSNTTNWTAGGTASTLARSCLAPLPTHTLGAQISRRYLTCLTNEQTNRRFRFIKKYVDFTLARSIIIGRLKRRDKPVHKRTGERDRLLLRHPALGRGGGEGRKTCFCEPFYAKNDHFARTGLGQTHGKLKTETRFLIGPGPQRTQRTLP